MKKIRFANISDCPSILKIYSLYIDTPITFEYSLPSNSEFEKRFANIVENYPYLVCEEEGYIKGYAYAHRFREREAYQWNAELSIYLDEEYLSKGLGKKLYSALMDILKIQGIRTVYGLVTVPNIKSEKLHYSLGFERAGTFRDTGYKGGKWRDVALFEKKIGSCEENPSSFIPINKIPKETLENVILYK